MRLRQLNGLQGGSHGCEQHLAVGRLPDGRDGGVLSPRGLALPARPRPSRRQALEDLKRLGESDHA
jgi:hypothetical protein